MTLLSLIDIDVISPNGIALSSFVYMCVYTYLYIIYIKKETRKSLLCACTCVCVYVCDVACMERYLVYSIFKFFPDIHSSIYIHDILYTYDVKINHTETDDT